MYRVVRCPICNHLVNAHIKENKTKYEMRNCCEHVPSDEMTREEIKEFTNSRF